MVKKIFSSIFAVFLIFTAFFKPLSVNAYQITSFEITAKAGMLVSLDTDEVLYSNNIDERIYPASITKIMTAILMLESDKFDPNGKLTMTKEALTLILGTGSAVSNLKQDEEITQLDLLYLVLVSSFGDCALLAAQFYGGTVENFVDMMNARAKELGLNDTVYLNPTGLHEDGHYTTVRDIYTITKFALQNETFRTVTETTKYTMGATNFSGARKISTTNFLQDPNTNYYYPYAKGVKTGYTDKAGRCLVSTASYNGYNYMCILMNCPAKAEKRYEFVESANLYRWAFNNFSFKEVATSTEPVAEIPVTLSLDTDFIPLYFKEPFVTILPNEADDSTIIIKTNLASELVEAPVEKGTILGTADIFYAEKCIGTVDLIAGSDIKASGLLIFAESLKKFFSSIYMKILYAVIGLAILIFIIMCIILNLPRRKRRRVKYKPYNAKRRKDDED